MCCTLNNCSRRVKPRTLHFVPQGLGRQRPHICAISALLKNLYRSDFLKIFLDIPRNLAAPRLAAFRVQLHLAIILYPQFTATYNLCVPKDLAQSFAAAFRATSPPRFNSISQLHRTPESLVPAPPHSRSSSIFSHFLLTVYIFHGIIYM